MGGRYAGMMEVGARLRGLGQACSTPRLGLLMHTRYRYGFYGNSDHLVACTCTVCMAVVPLCVATYNMRLVWQDVTLPLRNLDIVYMYI